MSKNKHRQQPIPTRPAPTPPPPPQGPHNPLGYDPKGKLVPVDVVSSKEAWSEFTLSDGTVIRTKALLMAVQKAEGQYSADGNPIYVIQFAGMNQVNAPDHLKKDPA
jgi:hypothetical protein